MRTGRKARFASIHLDDLEHLAGNLVVAPASGLLDTPLLEVSATEMMPRVVNLDAAEGVERRTRDTMPHREVHQFGERRDQGHPLVRLGIAAIAGDHEPLPGRQHAVEQRPPLVYPGIDVADERLPADEIVAIGLTRPHGTIVVPDHADHPEGHAAQGHHRRGRDRTGAQRLPARRLVEPGREQPADIGEGHGHLLADTARRGLPQPLEISQWLRQFGALLAAEADEHLLDRVAPSGSGLRVRGPRLEHTKQVEDPHELRDAGQISCFDLLQRHDAPEFQAGIGVGQRCAEEHSLEAELPGVDLRVRAAGEALAAAMGGIESPAHGRPFQEIGPGRHRVVVDAAGLAHERMPSHGEHIVDRRPGTGDRQQGRQQVGRGTRFPQATVGDHHRQPDRPLLAIVAAADDCPLKRRLQMRRRLLEARTDDRDLVRLEIGNLCEGLQHSVEQHLGLPRQAVAAVDHHRAIAARVVIAGFRHAARRDRVLQVVEKRRRRPLLRPLAGRNLGDREAASREQILKLAAILFITRRQSRNCQRSPSRRAVGTVVPSCCTSLAVGSRTGFSTSRSHSVIMPGRRT